MRGNSFHWRLCVLFAVCTVLFTCNTQDPWRREKNKFRELSARILNTSPNPVDLKELTFSSLQSMLGNLDPHSYFLDPMSLRSLMEDQSGEFYGIGIRVTLYDRQLTVISVLPDGPAGRMGILPGDIILEIEGNSTTDLSLPQAMKKMRGKKGSVVSIRIFRPGSGQNYYFSIQRTRIPLNTVTYQLVHPLDRRIGYISLQIFGQTTPEEVESALREFKEHNIRAVILDLRNNTGGSLPAAVSVADHFLTPEKVVVSVRGRHRHRILRAQHNTGYEHMPVAVLVNHASASASEIVAAALQENRAGVVLGERSFGKGLVETIYRLPAGCAMALTTAQYYTPNGNSLQRSFDLYRYPIPAVSEISSDRQGGVIPDLPVAGLYYSPLVSRLAIGGTFFTFSLELTRSGYQVAPRPVLGDELFDRFTAYLDNTGISFKTRSLRQQRARVLEEISRTLLQIQYSDLTAQRFILTVDPVSIRAVKALQSNLETP